MKTIVMCYRPTKRLIPVSLTELPDDYPIKIATFLASIEQHQIADYYLADCGYLDSKIAEM